LSRWLSPGTPFSAFRFSSPKYDVRKPGGAPGRWNLEGKAVIYTAENRSLAKLEVLAGGSPRMSQRLTRFEIPKLIMEKAERVAVLPATSRESREIGQRWMERGATAVLVVPSAIMPPEVNLILNPKHSDFMNIASVTESEEFRFDQRLAWTPAVLQPGTRRFLVCRRVPLPDERRYEPEPSDLTLNELFRHYRDGSDLRHLAGQYGLLEVDLVQAVSFALRLPEFSGRA
jgi:RES domain-containing protein